MSTRVTFGATGLSVSPICFGTWQLSPRFWGPQPEEELRSAMRAAFDGGINFFDTADAYGDGLAETVLGKFLASVPREEVVVTTKVFNHFNPDASRYPDLSPAHIIERCEASLRRLGVETIDLYLLHFFDQLTPLAAISETLETLKAQGKIRCYGASNFTVEQFRAARAFGAYDAVQPPYSLLDTAIENDLLPYCQAHNVGVMTYSTMHKGLLSGKYTGEETFSDFRRHHPDFQGERFRAIAAAMRDLAPMAEGYGLSLYQLILAATLMHPSVQVGVIGCKTVAQTREAVGALGKNVSRPDYFAIRAALTIGGAKKVKDATGGVK
ncbi:MAG: General stress protein 69 [bacterium ADurb.Bin429]|nr:MAG: General stress protein 69 [bacterium ADurb.Bin429]